MRATPPVQSQNSAFSMAAFILGLTCIIEVNIAGRLMGTDIICLVGAVFTLIRPNGPLTKPVSVVISLAFLWLISAILADLINSTALDDIARGWSRIIVLICAIYFLFQMSYRNTQWPISFWSGLAVGLSAKPFFVDQYGFADDPWKFAFALGAAGIGFLFINSMPASSKKRATVSMSVFYILAGLNLLYNYRSMFAITLFTALLLTFRRPISNIVFPSKTNKIAFFFFSLGALASIQILTLSYGSLAEAGYLGDVARSKFEAQERLNLGVLQAGRQESLASFEAIKDSPFFGHGSWAKDKRYVYILIDELESRGAAVSQSLRDRELIPSHSYIIGAWVDHGVGSLPFWLMSILLMLKGIKSALQQGSDNSEAILFLSLQGLWDIPFSPFGAQQRVLFAGAVAIICFAIMSKKPKSDHLRKRPLGLFALTEQ